MLDLLRQVRAAWWLEWPHESLAAWTRGTLLLRKTGNANRRENEFTTKEPPRAARLLIIRTGHLGDILHTIPFAQAVKRQRPDVRVELLAGPWSEKLAKRFDCFDEVISYAPDFAQFHRGDRRGVLPFRQQVAFLRALSGRGYYAAVATSPVHLSDQILLRAASAAVTVGTCGGLGEFPLSGFDCRRAFDSRMREAGWVSSFLADLGLAVEPAPLTFPITEAERNRAATFLGPLPPPRVVIAPGAGWPGKCWPVDRFAMLADLLVEKKRAAVVVIGAGEEKKLAAGMIAQMKNSALNLAGQTSLGESAAVIAASQLFIGNDSAPLHLAAAVGTPTLAMFGPTRVSKWAPPGARNRVLQHEGMCDGCIYWHCNAACRHDNRCMKAIGVEAAFETASALLDYSSP